MNCKPRDLAILVGAFTSEGRKNIGMIVEVMFLAPAGRFEMPDGTRCLGGNGDAWAIKSAGKPFSILTVGGWARESHYGVAHDCHLRPVSGVPIHDVQRDEVPA
ncbi:hypothetical protein HTY52_18105 [Cupriavidus taiwanensis]|uniref:hypothetical protein n=1 Tax=Cupriavidus taiwanensis TaxID=164546 RepID=UPI0015737AD5|nr:hypothetical protein [Cupriavidus taiwanensis]NSX16001.1 hypothetical protein [Cupriavidus taiwanensis]